MSKMTDKSVITSYIGVLPDDVKHMIADYRLAMRDYGLTIYGFKRYKVFPNLLYVGFEDRDQLGMFMNGTGARYKSTIMITYFKHPIYRFRMQLHEVIHWIASYLPLGWMIDAFIDRGNGEYEEPDEDRMVDIDDYEIR